MDTPRLIQEIQYVIAPAVMVSSSALLLLGFHNKFSSLANRFRALNQEKRLLKQKGAMDEAETARFSNLTEQIRELGRRASLVKTAILLTYLAIMCFVGTSILIFANVYSSFQLHFMPVAIFLLGFVFLLATAVSMILETNLFYRIISLEKKV